MSRDDYLLDVAKLKAVVVAYAMYSINLSDFKERNQLDFELASFPVYKAAVIQCQQIDF